MPHHSGRKVRGPAKQSIHKERKLTQETSRPSGFNVELRRIFEIRGEVNGANCLIKNLLEIDSLPQLRNLLEMGEISSAVKRLVGGEKDEAKSVRHKKGEAGDPRNRLPRSQLVSPLVKGGQVRARSICLG